MDITEFGFKLRDARTEAGLTQKQLAAIVGITAASLSAYESGKQVPPVTVACDLADALHVRIEWLCDYINNYYKLANKSLVKANITSCLGAISTLFEEGDLIELEVVKDEDTGKESAKLISCNDAFNHYLLTVGKLTSLHNNGAMSYDLYKACTDEAERKYGSAMAQELEAKRQ